MTRRLSIHWIVVGAAFVTLLLAAGARSAPGVLLDPLHEEFGWSKATIGLAVSINVVLFGLVGPFAAALQQRFGLRRVTMMAKPSQRGVPGTSTIEPGAINSAS